MLAHPLVLKQQVCIYIHWKSGVEHSTSSEKGLVEDPGGPEALLCPCRAEPWRSHNVTTTAWQLQLLPSLRSGQMMDTSVQVGSAPIAPGVHIGMLSPDLMIAIFRRVPFEDRC